jgi:D-glycero-D-manno-heptose 1,7-bisphosphate phosphatase
MRIAMTTNKAVFLDRDGTIVWAFPGRPANTPAEIKLLPGAVEGLRKLKDAGYLLIVITNQGGIALGYMTEETLLSIHKKLDELLLEEGGPKIDAYYHCPHMSDAMCYCRKPKPGMVNLAAVDYGVDLERSFLVGDSLSDVQTAIAAGIPRTVMVVSDRFDPSHGANYSCLNLAQAAEFIIGQDQGIQPE